MKFRSIKLQVKESLLPGAGKGLFTAEPITRGTIIIEYKGVIRKWKDVKYAEADNPYIMNISREYVIDAGPLKAAKARFANDARGAGRVEGLDNNAAYHKEGDHVYIKAIKSIPAGAEILVGYGKDYWVTMKKNSVIDKKKK